jgi:hypothetical protein
MPIGRPAPAPGPSHAVEAERIERRAVHRFRKVFQTVRGVAQGLERPVKYGPLFFSWVPAYASSEKSVGLRYALIGRRKLGSRSPRTRCGIVRLQRFPVRGQLPSNQFALSGKHNVVNRGLAFQKRKPTTPAVSKSARCAFFGQLTKPLKSQRAPICPWRVCQELLFVPQRGHGLDARSSTRRSVACQEHGTQKNSHGGSQCERIIGLDPIKK